MFPMFPDPIANAIAIGLARMVEEDAVALVTDLRKKDRFRGVYRIGDIKRHQTRAGLITTCSSKVLAGLRK